MIGTDVGRSYSGSVDKIKRKKNEKKNEKQEVKLRAVLTADEVQEFVTRSDAWILLVFAVLFLAPHGSFVRPGQTTDSLSRMGIEYQFGCVSLSF